ncbi:conserved hypothetical protein [Vibrio phage 424E50-1]|nr:conserved hypothetical protein [Vibrio phage 424E50-1]
MNNLFRGYGDPVAARIKTVKGSLVSDEKHIQDFLSTGTYHKDSKFKRLVGVKWEFTCGGCLNTYIRSISCFKSGKDACGCANKGSGFSRSKSADFYIVRWYDDNVSYLKFGITNQEIIQRIKQQSRKSHLDYTILHEFYHEDGNVAADCEKYLMSVMETGVCTKELLPDGYTETCHDTQQNIDLILSQVNKFGLK